jgi:ketosteroid isomerase-like protein
VGIPEEQLAERLRQGYDAFNRGDYEAATEWVHPDVVYVSPGSISEVRGAEALRAWMEPDAFEGQVSKPHEIEIAGNRALIHQSTRRKRPVARSAVPATEALLQEVRDVDIRL